jgi:hypothetical protein
MSDERAGLAAVFARMGDEELLERWSSGNLTPDAVQIAGDELSRRGIEAPDPGTPEPPVPESPAPADLVFEVVARSLEPLEIEMLRARLAAEGIDAIAADTGINQVNALYSIALGGVRLLVPHGQAAEARLIIELVRSGRFALRDDETLE